MALEFGDVRRLLDERLDDKVGRADFFRGGITVTSLTPLRWVPFRVVCLLGHGPVGLRRRGRRPVTTSRPWSPASGTGTRGARPARRCLEAVLAAEDHLVVVRDGHDVRTNQAVPRAVPTAELYESVLASVATGAASRRGPSPRDRPPPSALRRAMLRDGEAGGRHARGVSTTSSWPERWPDGTRPPAAAVPGRPVESLTSDVIELSVLHRFLRNPTAAFVGDRLAARLPRPEDETPTALTVDLGGLTGWTVGSRLLEARQYGRTFDEWLHYERRLGTLPPPPLGEDQIRILDRTVQAMLDTAHQAGMVPGPAVPLAGGRPAAGRHPGRRLGPAPSGRGPRAVRPARSSSTTRGSSRPIG